MSSIEKLARRLRISRERPKSELKTKWRPGLALHSDFNSESMFDKATTETARKLFSLLVEQKKGHEAKLRAQLHEVKSEIEMERMKSK